MVQDYTKMTFAADLNLYQRLHCMVSVAGMARKREMWRRLLLPGPGNFLGWSLARK